MSFPTMSVRSDRSINSHFAGGSLSNISIVDRQRLLNALDANDVWKKVAASAADRLNLTPQDVQLMAQSVRANKSPADKLLIHMKDCGIRILDLYLALKKANLLYAMEIIKDYVPVDFHEMYMIPTSLPTQSYTDTGFNTEVSHPMPNISAFLGRVPDAQMPVIGDQSILSVPATGHRMDLAVVEPDYVNVKRPFRYEDLIAATDNFTKNCIASGEFKDVYKVELNHTVFAAKVFKEAYGYDNMMSDLNMAKYVDHTNIVALRGHCIADTKIILLYEYMANGTLREFLDTKQGLDMDARVSILCDAAKGLLWLHGNQPPILHRNIRSSKILLDSNMTAKLCGLNNAKYADKKSSTSTSAGTRNTHISTHISHSSQLFLKNRGYIAREVMDGRPCDKSDTYAFGVVIFEVCTGLLAYDDTRRLGACLTEHIERHLDKGDGFSLCDDTIPWHKEIYNKLFSLAEQCTDDRKQSRPKMSLVYNQLVEIQKEVKSSHYPTNDDTDDDEACDSSLSLNITDGRRSTTPTDSYCRTQDYRLFHNNAVAGYPAQSLYTMPTNNPSYPVPYHHAASSVPAGTQATVGFPQYPNSVPGHYLVGANTPVEHSEFSNSNEPNQSPCYSLPLRIPAITHEAIEHTDNSALEERQQTNEPGLLHASHSDAALSSDMSELSFTSIRSPNPSGYSNDIFTHMSGTSNNVLGRQPATSLSSDPRDSSNYENEGEYENQEGDVHDYVNDYFAQQGEESLDESLLAAFSNLPTKE